MIVRTRFAPSPTGVPHIGNIRTALFCYFFAKANKGEFILRIEDTDQARIVDGALEAIKDSLTWIGVGWDELITQSERLDIYRDHAQQLIDQGLARKEEGAIKFITSKDGTTSWVDGVGNKKISFGNSTVEDFVILKSDGFPTYHLANIIDDHLMNVTHVIRGEDWIPSTPKHIMIYLAFGWDLPTFVHVPNVYGPDGKKLSKRFGAKSVLDFKKEGYLAEALVNYLALLGWSPKSDQEMFSVDEIISQFSLQGINNSPAVFDNNKLDWMNGEYLRAMSDEELVKRLEEYKVEYRGNELLYKLVPLSKERIKTLKEFFEINDFMFEKPKYDPEIIDKKLKIKNKEKALNAIIQKLEEMRLPWTQEVFEQTFRSLAEKLSISVRDMFQLIRIGISGKLVSPPMLECMQILGEKESIERIKEAKDFYIDNH